MWANTPEQQQALEKLKGEIARSLKKGKSEQEVVDDLVHRGLAHDRAGVLVSQVGQSMRQTSTENERMKALSRIIRRRYIDMIAAGLAIIAGNIVYTFVANWLLLPAGISVVIYTAGCAGIGTIVFGVVGLIRFSKV